MMTEKLNRENPVAFQSVLHLWTDICASKTQSYFSETETKMTDMTTITPLSSIKSFQNCYRVRVRICRIWTPRKYDSEEYDGLHCVLVDEHATAIHAFIGQEQVEKMSEKLLPGQLYEIYRFGTRDYLLNQPVVNHKFHGHTVFIKLPESVADIPQHSFRLIEFEQLPAFRDTQSHLADVYGCIKSIRPPHLQYSKKKQSWETKCDITIEDLRRGTLRIALWGAFAKTFDVKTIMKHPPPALAVIAGLRLGTFEDRVVGNNTAHTCVVLDPITPLRDAYLHEFSRPGDKLELHGTFFSSETNQPEDIKSVEELTALNPQEYMTKTAFCKGVIAGFRKNGWCRKNGWWYRCCLVNNCYKQCFKKEELTNKYECNNKDRQLQTPIPRFRVNTVIEDEVSDKIICLMGRPAEQFFGCDLQSFLKKHHYPTEETLPEEILFTIGQEHIFELRGNKYGDWNVVSTQRKALGPTAIISEAETTAKEPVLETPEKATSLRKRGNEMVQKDLFPTACEKKSKRIAAKQTPSSSNAEQKDKTD